MTGSAGNPPSDSPAPVLDYASAEKKRGWRTFLLVARLLICCIAGGVIGLWLGPVSYSSNAVVGLVYQDAIVYGGAQLGGGEQVKAIGALRSSEALPYIVNKANSSLPTDEQISLNKAAAGYAVKPGPGTDNIEIDFVAHTPGQIAALNTAVMAYLRMLRPPLAVIGPRMIPAIPTIYPRTFAMLIGMLAGAGTALLLPRALQRIRRSAS